MRGDYHRFLDQIVHVQGVMYVSRSNDSPGVREYFASSNEHFAPWEFYSMPCFDGIDHSYGVHVYVRMHTANNSVHFMIGGGTATP